MAEQHTPSTDTPVIIDTAVTIHTVPLPSDHRVLVLVEANAHVTHVLALDAQPARDLVVGLLEAIDVADPRDGDDAWWDHE
jgi:hypothetical protein